MLTAIVRFSLRFRGIVIALSCALLGYGVYSITVSQYDVFPEFAPPEAVIQTEAAGLSPEQVEVLVTQPIESAINGVPAIAGLRSGSIQGLSVITVIFRTGSDIYRDRQVVAERLSALSGRIPAGVHLPVLTPLTSSTSIVLAVGLTSQKQSLMTIRTVADWTVLPRVLAVPGVAKVSTFGGEIKQVQIQFDLERLAQHNLSVEDLLAAARRAIGIRGAGFIDTPNQRIVLQTEGQTTSSAQLARAVLLQQNGANLTLGDVAHVVDAPQPPIGAASVMGQPAVMLMVSSQYGANTLEVTRALESALEELHPALAAQGIEIHTDIFRPANFIVKALQNIRTSLFVGAALVVVVLFLFLLNFRTAAISCTAIPLSLLSAVIVLNQLGFNLNTMTLGGLAIAIGEVVDDAVIDVENIYRRLRLNRSSPNPVPTIRVVLDASIEVRSAVVYATFAVILVFFPVLTMTGLSGRIFAPLGVAYILAILASLVVALTVTPALCLLMLGDRELPPQDPPVVRWSKRKYENLLLRVEKYPRAVLAVVAVLILVGVAILPFLEGSFLPELREGHFIIHMTAVPGTSVEGSLRLGTQVTRELQKLPFVRLVAQRVGRAELADDTAGIHSSEIEVDLKPISGEEAEEAGFTIRQTLANFPGASFTTNTFLSERVDETLSGYTAPVVVNLFGNDLDALDEKAGEIFSLLGKMPHAADVQLQSPPGMPQVVVRLRDADVARWGFDPVDVLDVVSTAYGGETIGQVYEGNRVFDVSAILAPAARRSIAQISALSLRNPTGNYVPLHQIADIYETSGRYIVLHEGARRVQTITCNVVGGDVNAFVAEARSRIGKLSLPPGVYIEFAGTAGEQARSQRELLIHSLLAGLGIVLLLSVVMGSSRNLLLVLLNIPFALVGGVLAVVATGGLLSLGSLIGFVALFGITLRNSIMMISHYEHLVAAEGMEWGQEAAMRGASERLAPILMTALVTGLGLLPLALGASDPGREIEGPMAIVILGGLVTSTALNLLVLPTLALRYGRFEKVDLNY